MKIISVWVTTKHTSTVHSHRCRLTLFCFARSTSWQNGGIVNIISFFSIVNPQFHEQLDFFCCCYQESLSLHSWLLIPLQIHMWETTCSTGRIQRRRIKGGGTKRWRTKRSWIKRRRTKRSRIKRGGTKRRRTNHRRERCQVFEESGHRHRRR